MCCRRRAASGRRSPSVKPSTGRHRMRASQTVCGSHWECTSAKGCAPPAAQACAVRSRCPRQQIRACIMQACRAAARDVP